MANSTPMPDSLLGLCAVVSQRARIEGIRLSKSNMRSTLMADDLPGKVRYGIGGRTECDRETGRILVVASFELSAFPKSQNAHGEGPDETGTSLRIRAEFVLTYKVESLDGITDEHINAFGRMNGIHNAWPYWREYVQSTTARMGLPPLTLPLMTGDALVKTYEQAQAAGDAVEGAPK